MLGTGQLAGTENGVPPMSHHVTDWRFATRSVAPDPVTGAYTGHSLVGASSSGKLYSQSAVQPSEGLHELLSADSTDEPGQRH
jgi:hypothetical protein